jgi:uncharacterized protein (DUF1800 family)
LKTLSNIGREGAPLRSSLAALLCVSLTLSQALAETAIPAPSHPAPLTKQEKTLHALNRLTFGPKPGDEAAVSKMGLEAWFQQQLHPETIDDSALEARLQEFPAMQLSQGELMRRFPSPQMIKQAARRGDPLPSDPAVRAIYADAEYAYDAKIKAAGVAAKAADDSMAATAGTLMSDGTVAGATQSDSMMADAATPAKGKGKRPRVDKMDADGVEAVLALPANERMQRLIAMSPVEMQGFREGLKPVQRLQLMQGLSPAQVEVVAAMQGAARVVAAEALETRLLRDVYSQRQLQAVMTDFWLNHFSVYVKKNQNEPYFLPGYQKDVILPRSLGKFEDLLVADAESPAMLTYLDNWQSIGPDSIAASRVKRVQQVNPNGKIAQALPKGINENYARELMELHTLGVGGGYTQKDVIEVAKCFTGWTVDRPYQGGRGDFIFEPNRHEPGAKVVLGHTIKENGMYEGLEVLHILATSPATAKFVSTKLAVRFVSDNPPQALVDRMAATFVKTDGDIKAVLTTMFHSPEFWSPEVYRAKVKTPIEFMVSALRASDAQVNNALPLVQAMERLGMPIYGMQTPNGYSWKQDEWVSSNALISRMNFSLLLSGDRVAGTRTDWPALLGSTDATVESAPTPATEAKLETLVLGEPAAARTRSTVLAQFNDTTVQGRAEQDFNAKPVSEDAGEMAGGGRLMQIRAGRGGKGGFGQNAGPATPLDTMAGLLLGSPDFQRR